MQIEGSEAKFDVNIVGNITKESYLGKFKVKCLLSPLEEIEADKIYRELLGNNFQLAEDRVKQKAFALAQLQVRVIEEPPFWKHDIIGGGDIPDDNVLLDVLELAITAQEKYIKGKEEEMKRRQEMLTRAVQRGQLKPESELDEVTEQELDNELEELENNQPEEPTEGEVE